MTRGIDENVGGEETTAREIMTELTRKDPEEELVGPEVEKRVQGRAPKNQTLSATVASRTRKVIFGSSEELEYGGLEERLTT